MRSLFHIFLFALMAAPVFGQPRGEITFELPVRWSPGVSDSQESVGVTAGVEHWFRNERVRLFYDLDMETVGTEESLRTWLHNAGASATWGSAARAFDAGGAVFWRANEGTWADAGFKGVNLLASGRLQPTSGVTLSSTYAFYWRAFPDQPALDQVEHYASARLLANAPTRTTLVAVLSAGRKQYDGRALTTVYQGVPFAPADRPGRGWRQGLFAPVHVELSGDPGARHDWSWAARIAQSLDDRTGVWVEREERRTGGDLPPAIVWTPPLFYEDGVYDDPYVIDARTWRAGAKHVFGSGHELSAWGSRSERAYAGLLRGDTLTRAGAEALVPLSARGRASLDAVVRYAYFRNDSSDVLEEYRAHQVGAGIRVAF